MILWLNGALLPTNAARIDPSDRGLTLGDGVFETIRVKEGRPMHLALHLARLRAGAAVVGIPVGWPLDWSDAELARAIVAVAEAAGLANAAARLTLTRGPAPRGVLPPVETRPTVLITAGTMPPPAPPAHAIIAASTRRNQDSPLSRVKSLNYLDSIIARREATARGADDAILLDTRGRLAESTAANLFVVLGEAILTPPVTDGVLPGITRARLLVSGIAQERTLLPEDLFRVSAAFLTNSLGVRALVRIEDWMFNPDHPALCMVGQWWEANALP
jgi:branched-chain amino acid aminotransferase